MGTWGHEPWANDSAAAWFDGTFEVTGLAEQVQQTLQLNTDEFAEEIRAAAFVLTVLGEKYVWPTDSRERCIQIAKAQLLKLSETVDDPQIKSSLDSEIHNLENLGLFNHE